MVVRVPFNKLLEKFKKVVKAHGNISLGSLYNRCCKVVGEEKD
jgi:hypothetical protein